MSSLEIQREDFPDAIPADAKLGDMFTLTVRGQIVNMGADMIDVSGVGGREYVAGCITIKLLVTRIDR